MDYSWLAYILILFCGCVVGLLRRKYLNSSSQRSWLLLVLVLVVEAVAYFFKHIMGNNMPIYHFSTTAYLLIYFWIFSSEIKLPFPLIGIAIAIIFLEIVLGTFHQKFNVEFPSTLYLFMSVVVVVLSLNYLQNLLKIKEVASLFDYPLFFISFGLLFFYTINLLGFGAFKFIYFQKNESFTSFFTLLRKSSNYLLYIIFILAFLSKQASLNNDKR